MVKSPFFSIFLSGGVQVKYLIFAQVRMSFFRTSSLHWARSSTLASKPKYFFFLSTSCLILLECNLFLVSSIKSWQIILIVIGMNKLRKVANPKTQNNCVSFHCPSK